MTKKKKKKVPASIDRLRNKKKKPSHAHGIPAMGPRPQPNLPNPDFPAFQQTAGNGFGRKQKQQKQEKQQRSLGTTKKVGRTPCGPPVGLHHAAVAGRLGLALPFIVEYLCSPSAARLWSHGEERGRARTRTVDTQDSVRLYP